MLENRGAMWSLAVPLLALAGLFGMHGLGDHTATHSGTHVAAPAPMAGHAVPIAGQDGPVLSPLIDSDTGGVVGLCVSLLLLGGILLGLVLGRSLRRTPWELPRQVWLRAPIPRSRAPDPPTASLLSVCRC